MNRKQAINTILILTILILLTANVNALGIAPSKKIISYDATHTHNISVRIINTDNKDMTLKISAEGSLAYLINITEPTINIKSDETEKEFTYTINLPPDLTPGTQTIIITIAEITDESDANAVSGLLTLSHQLIIKVPYTGLYAEGYISVSPTINAATIASISIANTGTEIIDTIEGKLNIRNLDGKIIYTKTIQEQHHVTPGSSAKIEEIFDLETPGVYVAEYDVKYDGKMIILNKVFNTGEFNLTITGASVSNFKLGTIAKLDVGIINNWNAPVDDVYTEIIVTDINGTIVGTTNTTKTTVNPKTDQITAYWDTTNIKTGQYTINLKIYAGNKIITQSYPSTINNDKFIISTQEQIRKTNYTPLIVLIILALISIATLLVRRNKKVYK